MDSIFGALLLANVLGGPGTEFTWPGLNFSTDKSEPQKTEEVVMAPIQEPVVTNAIGPTQSGETALARQNWCIDGHLVMIPDGREGRVTSTEGEVCKVLAYGEAYVSLWTFDLVEPVYPQDLPVRNFGH